MPGQCRLGWHTLQFMSEVERHSSQRVEVHRIRRMSGRDPDELHRAATPLELLFDLTFVIGFGIAASQFAANSQRITSVPGWLRSPSRPSPSAGRGSTSAGSPRRTTQMTGSTGC